MQIWRLMAKFTLPLALCRTHRVIQVVLAILSLLVFIFFCYYQDVTDIITKLAEVNLVSNKSWEATPFKPRLSII